MSTVWLIVSVFLLLTVVSIAMVGAKYTILDESWSWLVSEALCFANTAVNPFIYACRLSVNTESVGCKPKRNVGEKRFSVGIRKAYKRSEES